MKNLETLGPGRRALLSMIRVGIATEVFKPVMAIAETIEGNVNDVIDKGTEREGLLKEAEEKKKQAQIFWLKEAEKLENEQNQFPENNRDYLDTIEAYSEAGKVEKIPELLERHAKIVETTFNRRTNDYGIIALAYQQIGNEEKAKEYAKKAVESARAENRDFGIAAYIAEKCGDNHNAKILWYFQTKKYHNKGVIITIFGKESIILSYPEILAKAGLEPEYYQWNDEIDRCYANNDFEKAEKMIHRMFERKKSIEGGGGFVSKARVFNRLETKYREFRETSLDEAKFFEDTDPMDAAQIYEKFGLLDKIAELIPAVRSQTQQSIARFDQAREYKQVAIWNEAFSHLLQLAADAKL